MKLTEGKVLSEKDRRSQTVIKCVKNLIRSNRDIACINEHKWETFVIDDEDTLNAFVTPVSF